MSCSDWKIGRLPAMSWRKPLKKGRVLHGSIGNKKTNCPCFGRIDGAGCLCGYHAGDYSVVDRPRRPSSSAPSIYCQLQPGHDRPRRRCDHHHLSDHNSHRHQFNHSHRPFAANRDDRSPDRRRVSRRYQGRRHVDRRIHPVNTVAGCAAPNGPNVISFSVQANGAGTVTTDIQVTVTNTQNLSSGLTASGRDGPVYIERRYIHSRTRPDDFSNLQRHGGYGVHGKYHRGRQQSILRSIESDWREPRDVAFRHSHGHGGYVHHRVCRPGIDDSL